MPLYDFEHAIQLSPEQKQNIAEAVTDWHATTFKAPRYIVACRFIDVSKGEFSDSFIGGTPKKINRLFVSLRSGTGRTPEQLEGITNKLISMWEKSVGSSSEAELRAVYIKGTLDSAYEGKFFLPMPGKFEQWVKENAGEFQKLADAGDEDFIGVMNEIKTRTEFQ